MARREHEQFDLRVDVGMRDEPTELVVGEHGARASVLFHVGHDGALGDVLGDELLAPRRFEYAQDRRAHVHDAFARVAVAVLLGDRAFDGAVENGLEHARANGAEFERADLLLPHALEVPSLVRRARELTPLATLEPLFRVRGNRLGRLAGVGGKGVARGVFGDEPLHLAARRGLAVRFEVEPTAHALAVDGDGELAPP
ncbi:MAG TPA: hypothetical protein VFQ35_10240 [Polyangiaceae bacterium]|nr:hypothetical protein [Polyangiaceae bacterium]